MPATSRTSRAWNRSALPFVRGDICDEARGAARCSSAHAIDTLVHFAAESHVDRSILGPDDFIRTNVVGTHALLKAAKSRVAGREAVPAHRFHHVSTDEVYGSLGRRRCAVPRGDAVCAELAVFGAARPARDHLVRAYHETYGLHTTITQLLEQLRAVSVPREADSADHPQHPRRQAAAGVRRRPAGARLAARRRSLRGDRARASTRGKPGEVYNIGGNSETTNIEIVRRLCALADRHFAADARLRAEFPDSPAAQGRSAAELITHVRDRPGHDRRYAIDYRKAQRELGYGPGRDLAAGLESTFAWYLANTAWWRALLGRDYKAWVAKNYTR